MSAWEGKRRANATDIPSSVPTARVDSRERRESTPGGAGPPDRTELEVLYDEVSDVLAAVIEDEGIAAPGSQGFLRQAVEALRLARDGLPGLTGARAIELTHWARMGAEYRAKFMGFDSHAEVRNHFIEVMERLAPTLPAAEDARSRFG